MPLRSKRKGKTRKRPTQAPKSKNNENQLGFIAKALRGLGGLGGGTLGAMIGAPAAGTSVGNSLGAAISKWLGAGDYTVAQNSITMKAAANIPMMHNSSQSIVVRHREFIGTINGSIPYLSNYSFPLNPGMSTTFPWLSQIASRFQEYKFKGLVFHYVPTSGTFNGSSAALGAVMMQTTYRTTDQAPSSKTELLNEYCANECVPYETMAHPIECDPKENPFAVHYVRTGEIPSGEPLMYDVGRTFIATQGMADTGVVGDLWVTYEVELKKPLVASAVTSSPSFFSKSFAAPTSTAFFNGTPGPSIGNLPVTCSNRSILLPPSPGRFFVCVEILSSGLTSATAVQWLGALSVTNLGFWNYNGTSATNDTNASGTTLTLNNLRFTVGVYLLDSTSPGIIAFPTATWTGGSTSQASVVVFNTGA